VVLYGYEVVTLDSLLTYIGSTLPVDSVVGNNVYFNFGTLYPGDMLAGYIHVWSPSEEFLGTQICISAQAFGFSDFVQTQLVHENSEISCDYVLCSYDPNDKQVQPPGMVDSHAILTGTDLEYTIRFQNTGNAPASTVVVRDTLHTSLDISTFSTLGSTHDHSILIHTDTREVVFTFYNIQLPDSASDPAGSQGTLGYSIRPLPQSEPGILMKTQPISISTLIQRSSPIPPGIRSMIVRCWEKRWLSGRKEIPFMLKVDNTTSGSSMVMQYRVRRTIVFRSIMWASIPVW
jgi:uncharacterized repeat protein (TIGR01451 family)